MSVGEKKNATLRNSRGPQSGGDDRGAIGEPEGFTFIGLMVAIALINISLAVALTSWATINKRAKETELIWRGQQYVRALRCHQAQTGALPDELDELLESDCIRAVYPDPMSPDGEWRIIRESDLEFAQGGTEFGVTRTAGAVLRLARSRFSSAARRHLPLLCIRLLNLGGRRDTVDHVGYVALDVLHQLFEHLR